MNNMENGFGRSLSITSLGPCTVDRPRPALPPFAMRPVNETRDIEGATSVNKYAAFARESLFLRSDVEGSTSKPLIHARNTRDNALYIDDIEGTRCMVKDRRMFTQRVVNPLEPEYHLPSFQMAPIEEPKFIRDHITIDDIERTKTKPMYPFKMRDTYNVGDIEGTNRSWKPSHVRALRDAITRDIMQVQPDARKKRFVERTARSVNPLDPQYVIYGTEYCDELRYTKPKPLKKYIAENNLLKTVDIPYATAGYKEEEIPIREIRNIMHIGDIEGAQADTIRPGITTKRSLNPLVPLYPSLDGYGEVLEPIMHPLIPAAVITIPTLRPPCTTGNLNSNSNTQSTSHSTWGGSASSSSFSFFDTASLGLAVSRPPLPNNNNNNLPELNFTGPLAGTIDRSSSVPSFRQHLPSGNSNNSNSNSARTGTGLPLSASTTTLGSGIGKMQAVEGRAEKERRAEIDAVRALE